MKKEEIIKLYKEKIKKFTYNNFLYFEKNRPQISDAKFDALKKEILQLEKDYTFLKHKNSPSKNVGFKPSKNFKKVSHKVPMLSLANAFSEEDLKNFEKKILNFLDQKQDKILKYSAEPKIDGISASLTYKKGRFTQGLSRGDGKQGEDITSNLLTINDIPKFITKKDFPKEIDIRGEVFIKNSDFKKIKDNFANPRNAASGSLRQKNPSDTKKIPLKFIAYTYGYQKGLEVSTQSEFLEKLKKWGFKINPQNKVVSGIKNLMSNYEYIENRREELDFDIDGIVYKINDLSLQKRLGNVANAPRWAIAHKFSANKSVSKILNIDIQVGRTGALTPVAKIKPVRIGGVVVSNATLHNEDEILRKDIRVGDTVIIERAGDVIPHVVSVDIKKRDKDSKKFVFPVHCPSCGSLTVKDYNEVTKKKDAVRRCSSVGYDCEEIAKEKIKHFVSKEAFNIDGFGKKIVEKFWQIGFVRLPQDIFKLNYDKIASLDGWGKLSVANLRYSINEKKIISLEKFIYSLGIRHIGLENAKLISKHLKKLSSLIDLSKKNNFQELLNVDGIGETQINSIKNFFSNHTNLMVLEELGQILTIKNQLEPKKTGILSNKTFMLTGKLNGMSRAEAKSLIELNSGSIISNISKKLDFLIAGEKPTKRKVDMALALNIKVLSQEEWNKMLKKT